MLQSEFPWCLQQQPNQQGQEGKGSPRWDTCWSLNEHNADPVCPRWCVCEKTLLEPPQLAWGATECAVRGTITHGPCKTSCSRGGKRMSDLPTMSEPSCPVIYLEPWCSTHVYHCHQYRGSLGRGQIPHPC